MSQYGDVCPGNKTYEDAITNTDVMTCEDATVNTDVVSYVDAIVNTEPIICEEASTNTLQPALVSKETMVSSHDFAISCSTQTTLKYFHIDHDKKMVCDACTMTKPNFSSFQIEKIQNDDDAIRFYTGFPIFKILMVCFIFLDESVSKLVGISYQSAGKPDRPHILSPLNEFFSCYVNFDWDYWKRAWYTNFTCHNQQCPESAAHGLISVILNLKKCHFGLLEKL